MNWYGKLSKSEKKLIHYGLLIIVPVLLWAFVYQPLTKSLDTKYKQKFVLAKQYQQMDSSKNQLKKHSNNNNKFARDMNKPFISWIDGQLAKAKLSQFVTRSEPKDNQTLILSFESIIFDDLIKWLEPLELSYNISISEVDVNLTDRSNGLCNARITLEEK